MFFSLRGLRRFLGRSCVCESMSGEGVCMCMSIDSEGFSGGQEWKLVWSSWIVVEEMEYLCG